MCLEVRVPQGALLDVVTDHLVRARLLTACFPESGVWLEALPLSNVRLKVVNEILRIFNFYIIIEHIIIIKYCFPILWFILMKWSRLYSLLLHS